MGLLIFRTATIHFYDWSTTVVGPGKWDLSSVTHLESNLCLHMNPHFINISRLCLPVYEYHTDTLARALQTANLDETEVVALLALLYTINCMLFNNSSITISIVFR